MAIWKRFLMQVTSNNYKLMFYCIHVHVCSDENLSPELHAL